MEFCALAAAALHCQCHKTVTLSQRAKCKESPLQSAKSRPCACALPAAPTVCLSRDGTHKRQKQSCESTPRQIHAPTSLCLRGSPIFRCWTWMHTLIRSASSFTGIAQWLTSASINMCVRTNAHTPHEHSGHRYTWRGQGAHTLMMPPMRIGLSARLHTCNMSVSMPQGQTCTQTERLSGFVAVLASVEQKCYVPFSLSGPYLANSAPRCSSVMG